jgi:hypothetical protein
VTVGTDPTIVHLPITHTYDSDLYGVRFVFHANQLGPWILQAEDVVLEWNAVILD